MGVRDDLFILDGFKEGNNISSPLQMLKNFDLASDSFPLPLEHFDGVRLTANQVPRLENDCVPASPLSKAGSLISQLAISGAYSFITNLVGAIMYSCTV